MKKLLLFSICILISGCSYDEYKMPKDVYIKEEEVRIQVFEENRYLEELIKESNAKILNSKDILNTESIGIKKTTVSYEYNKRVYKHDLEYEVYDDIPPFVLGYTKNINVLVGSDYNICETINAIDNYDRNLSCKVEGNYDLMQVGIYNLSIISFDSSGNESKRDIKLNVVERMPNIPESKPPVRPKILFDDVIAKYKKDNTAIGIDVSKWQGVVDFDKVKNAGAEFVIMRMGVNSAIEKDIGEDSYFQINYKNAKKAGLKVGVYVYTTATTRKKAKEHAKWAIKTLKGEKLDFPIAFDWENWKYVKYYNISIKDLHDVYDTFASNLKKAGYDTMLYGSKYYLEKIWDVNNKTIWLAHYIDKTTYQGNYLLWQMCDTGRIEGINGDVDINILYK